MSDDDQPQEITSRSSLRKWRTELPNLYDDMKLDVYEFRLLAHYVRVGRCTEGTKYTAEKCQMSTGKVSDVRRSLADKGLIVMIERPTNNGIGYAIEVVDVWERNFRHFMDHKAEKEAAGKRGYSPGEIKPSPGEGLASPGETKKELYKKELNKNSAADAAGAELSSSLGLDEADPAASWIGMDPQQVEVPQGGNKAQRNAFQATCSQCGTTLTQKLDVCPNRKCQQPIRWIGSAAANARARKAAGEAADHKAKEMREGKGALTETTGKVLALAIAGAPTGTCQYKGNEERQLASYEAFYGATAVLEKAQRLHHGGAVGRGLLVQLLNILGTSSRGKQAEQQRRNPVQAPQRRNYVPPNSTPPGEVVKPERIVLDFRKPLDLVHAIMGDYGPEWRAKAEAWEAAEEQQEQQLKEKETGSDSN